MVKPVLFQVAGYQNSGKTTLSLTLIQKLAAKGLKVATVKHHGHGGRPEVVEGKDSDRHVKAGASVSLVEGGGRMVIHAENDKWSLSEEIDMLSLFKPDVILIEGYKNEPYPKAVILRDESDLKLVEKLQNIQVVLCRNAELAKMLQGSSLPVFEIDDGVNWILEYISSTH